MVQRRGAFYEAYGPIRGSCTHEHPSERGALVCVNEDKAAQAALGGTSDLRVYAVDRDGTRRRVWPDTEV